MWMRRRSVVADSPHGLLLGVSPGVACLPVLADYQVYFVKASGRHALLQIARIYLRILTLFTHKNRPLFQETY